MYSLNRKNKSAWKKGFHMWYQIKTAITSNKNRLNSYYLKCINSIFFKQNKQVQQIILHQYHSANIKKGNDKLVYVDSIQSKKVFDYHTKLIKIECPSCYDNYYYDFNIKSTLKCPNCRNIKKIELQSILSQIANISNNKFLMWVKYKTANNK
jgi:predicted Zn-ribbon and HTH transcriptional regulator